MTLFTHSQFRAGDTLVRFVRESGSGRIGLVLLPAEMEAAVVPHRATLGGAPEIDAVPLFDRPPPAVRVASLVQLKLTGDAYSASFGQGRTMLLGGSVDRFAFVDQQHTQDNGRHIVQTRLRDAAGLELQHALTWQDGQSHLTVFSTFVNRSAEAVTLEMLSSFALGGITPFADDDAPGRLRVHRFRSAWSAEGRLETRSLEALHLERSWTGSALLSERFGQVGTMPTRGWFPFAAVEDTTAGVTWAASVHWAGSWQMEIARQHDDVLLTGGLADREFGHWTKRVAPGESFATPPATLACVRGTLDDACDRLTAAQQAAADQQPAVEADLPIVFNEWCTTWGQPTHDRVLEIAERLRGTETKYLVIDDGWFTSDDEQTRACHGDWRVNAARFPHGLAATAAAVRAKGLIPGLWFEYETVGRNASGFSKTDWLLRRDGHPVTVGGRRFWDMTRPAVVDFLTDRMIRLLDECGIGYLKIDYNETVGLGCENAAGESLGEGLRQHVTAVHRFLDRLRQALPDLVIENCASGGHRLEPSIVGRTAMSSFSDAHELLEIPIIAAGLHRLILPRQSQIWAVLHAADSEQRLIYSLAATFLGRMCLSGEIDRLSEQQMRTVLAAQRLYRAAVPVIKHGTSRCVGEVGESWRHPRGRQGVLRIAGDGRLAMAVVHTFADGRGEIAFDLPDRDWRVAGTLATDADACRLDGRRLRVTVSRDFEAAVVLLAAE